jgi:hypothetical protein
MYVCERLGREVKATDRAHHPFAVNVMSMMIAYAEACAQQQCCNVCPP